jgi:hypothetical protein
VTESAATARDMARGLQLALDTTPAHSTYAWVNPDGLREVIAFLRRLAAPVSHRWHQRGTGWWCCVCENQCHKQHPCIDHAPCVPIPKATLCGGPHAN